MTEELIVAAGSNHVYIIENLDILNQPEILSMPGDIASVCISTCAEPDGDDEWYSLLIALKDGSVHQLLLSKVRRMYIFYLRFCFLF